MKRNLVRFVSHEIRTPLSTVNTGLDILLKAIRDPSSMDNESYESTLHDMKTECVAAIDILNDLLSYEKIDAGLLKLHKTVIPAVPFLRDSVRPFLFQVPSIIMCPPLLFILIIYLPSLFMHCMDLL